MRGGVGQNVRVTATIVPITAAASASPAGQAKDRNAAGLRLGHSAEIVTRALARRQAPVRLMPPSMPSTCPVTHVTPGSEIAAIHWAISRLLGSSMQKADLLAEDRLPRP
jgi:hypothetical protein